MYTFRISLIPEKRGKSIPESSRRIVQSLISRALEIQRRFELAESTAYLLDEMLNAQSGLAGSIVNTYEGNAFAQLRFQLFRLLIVDLCAAVLDETKGASSVRKLIQEMKRSDDSAIDSLKLYYADRHCLKESIEAPGMDAESVAALSERLIEETLSESRQAINDRWTQIKANEVLDGDCALRMKWARNKAITHYEKADADSLVALHDIPPHGNGALTYGEPIEFLRAIRPFVYDVIGLITSTSWDDGYGQFYARAFWDRFKNGHTNLSP